MNALSKRDCRQVTEEGSRLPFMGGTLKWGSGVFKTSAGLIWYKNLLDSWRLLWGVAEFRGRWG